MHPPIEQIVDRAIQLAASLDHGTACTLACREGGVPEPDIPTVAELVSAALLNREARPRAVTAAENAREAAILSLIPKHLAAIATELESESQRQGGGWGRTAIAAIHRGKPRWRQQWEARRRAALEVSQSPPPTPKPSIKMKYRFDIPPETGFRSLMIDDEVESLDPDGFVADAGVGDSIIASLATSKGLVLGHGWDTFGPDGAERMLVWSDEASAANDDGRHALCQIVRTPLDGTATQS